MTAPSWVLKIAVWVWVASPRAALWAAGISPVLRDFCSPWTTCEIMNLACTREWLICAEWHVSCFRHRSGIGEHAYILNSVRIIFKYHMSSVVFGTFLWLPMSSKWKLPVSFINLALKGQGVDAILNFRNLQWSGRAVLGMRCEGTSENPVAVMDWQKFSWSDQRQLHNKQKTFASATPPHSM